MEFPTCATLIVLWSLFPSSSTGAGACASSDEELEEELDEELDEVEDELSAAVAPTTTVRLQITRISKTLIQGNEEKRDPAIASAIMQRQSTEFEQE